MLRKLLVPLLFVAMVVLGASASIVGLGSATAKADVCLGGTVPNASGFICATDGSNWRRHNDNQPLWQPGGGQQWYPPQQQWQQPDWWWRGHYDAQLSPDGWNSVWYNGSRGPVSVLCNAPAGWYLTEWNSTIYWVSPW